MIVIDGRVVVLNRRVGAPVERASERAHARPPPHTRTHTSTYRITSPPKAAITVTEIKKGLIFVCSRARNFSAAAAVSVCAVVRPLLWLWLWLWWPATMTSAAVVVWLSIPAYLDDGSDGRCDRSTVILEYTACKPTQFWISQNPSPVCCPKCTSTSRFEPNKTQSMPNVSVAEQGC